MKLSKARDSGSCAAPSSVFSEHLMEAPEDDEELSKEGKRLLDEGYEDLDAGRTHTLEDVKLELDL